MEDPSSAIDDLFSTVLDSVEQVNILIIGRKETYEQIKYILKNEFGYTIYFSATIDDAIPNLIGLNFTIVILDQTDNNLDVLAVSNSVRLHHPLTRIVLLSHKIGVEEFSYLMNKGSIDAMLPLPTDYVSLIKILSEQEAKYSINKAVTSFVSMPPELSKASFLLLDPSLTFGDESQPLNFVGVMIASRTVPKFTRFFEETLAYDEILMSSYLSAITTLGGELFKNQESLKEINFGGISVIIRFHEYLQISFLVRNLTRHNYKKAEDRIDILVGNITHLFGKQLQSSFLKLEDEDTLNSMLDEFDKVDEKELGDYEKKQLKENLKSLEKQVILIYGSDLEHQEDLRLLLLVDSDDGDFEINYTVQITSREETAIKIIKDENCGVLILDSLLRKEKDPLVFAEFIKELSPPIQIIYIERGETINEKLVSGINADFLDYVCRYPTNIDNIQNLLELSKLGLQNSINIRQKSAIGKIIDSGQDSLSVARTLLRENLESFTEETLPELHGILITKEMEPIFEHFWEYDGIKIEFDRVMLAGIISSLQDAGDEMFTDKELLGSLELEGKNIFVHKRGQFLFVYFVKNVNPNTFGLINKEVEAVSSVFYEIMVEAGASIPYQHLQTIFLQIANKSKDEFTKLLRVT